MFFGTCLEMLHTWRCSVNRRVSDVLRVISVRSMVIDYKVFPVQLLPASKFGLLP